MEGEGRLFLLLYFAVLGFYLGTVYQRSKEARQNELAESSTRLYLVEDAVRKLQKQDNPPVPEK